MADPKDNGTGDGSVVTLTEEDLLKSIREVAGKPPIPETPAKKTVAVTRLAKSFGETLKEKASPGMSKALEVSELLQEFAGIVGAHVDNSLEQLSKSLSGSAERDLTIAEALMELKKSVDKNTDALTKFGQTPGASAAATPISAEKSDILMKSVGRDGNVQPMVVRKHVLSGLENLAKSVKPGTPEQSKYSQALIKFESTGQISDADLAAAQHAFKNPPAPAAA